MLAPRSSIAISLDQDGEWEFADMRMTEIRPLTGVRGIAALIVFLDHACTNLVALGVTIDAPELFRRLFLAGGRQVDIFFVLSGFILTLNYRDWFQESVTPSSFLEFMRRRIARIYPLHFVILVATVALVLIASSLKLQTNNGLDRFDMGSLFEHFLLLQSLNLTGRGASTWNPPSWSIGVEAVAYLIFPFLLYLTAQHAKRHALTLVAAAALVGILANVTTSWGIYGYAAMARGLPEFWLGCMAAYAINTKPAQWLQGKSGSVACAALLALVFLAIPSEDTNIAIALVTVPLLLTLAAQNPVSQFMAWRPVYFLGEISYSVYLGHFLFSSIAYRIVPIGWMKSGVLPTLVGLAALSAIVLALSTVSYYVIEKPGRDFLTRRKTAPRAAE